VTHLQLDHLRYIRHQSYRRDVHARLRRLIAEEPHAVSQMAVVHEVGNRCCVREAWSVTYSKLLAALAADGEPVLGVVL
jgi:anti-sigma factor RsiW